MTMSAHRILALAPAPGAHAVLVPVDGEAVVVDETRGHLHLLNGAGALVWQLLDGVSPLHEVCADIADVLGAPRATVDADVTALVEQLLAEGLVVDSGFDRPPLPDELGDPCDCGADHQHDAVDRIEIPGNP